MTNKVAFINENDNDYHLDLQDKYAENIKKIFGQEIIELKAWLNNYLLPLIAK